MTALAILHRETILERLANGEFLKQVAQDLGIKPPSISRPLASDPEYLSARKEGAQLRLEKQYILLANAEDDAKNEDGNVDLQAAANLARVREAAWKAAAWFAEREFPERWGQRNQGAVSAENMADLLMAVSSRMLKVAQEQQRLERTELDITPTAQSLTSDVK